MKGEHLTYFDSFRVKHIPIEIKKSIGNKNKIKYCFFLLFVISVVVKMKKYLKKKINCDIKNSFKMDEENKQII